MQTTTIQFRMWTIFPVQIHNGDNGEITWKTLTIFPVFPVVHIIDWLWGKSSPLWGRFSPLSTLRTGNFFPVQWGQCGQRGIFSPFSTFSTWGRGKWGQTSPFFPIFPIIWRGKWGQRGIFSPGYSEWPVWDDLLSSRLASWRNGILPQSLSLTESDSKWKMYLTQ